MGKQIVAGLTCVLVGCITLLVPFSAMFGANELIASVPTGDVEMFSGLALASLATAVAASAVSFLSLIYLELHYGTMALLLLSALVSSIGLFFTFPIGAAAVGSGMSILLAAVISFGLWKLLKWVYDAPIVSNPTEEF